MLNEISIYNGIINLRLEFFITDLFADVTISIHGAQENNLKDVSLDIPKHKTTVFTGLSGSGKSSLVFDTLAAIYLGNNQYANAPQPRQTVQVQTILPYFAPSFAGSVNA